MPLKYIAIDPGKTVGFAHFSETGENLAKGQLHWEEFNSVMALLAKAAMDTGTELVIICEDYRIRHGGDQQANMWIGNTFETCQVIGMVRMFATMTNSELVFQQANILPVATTWTGIKMPANHANSHWVSAYNHGQYYLISNKINANPRVDELKKRRAAVMAEIERDKAKAES